jgi:diaminopimelate epimerase
MRIEFSKMHGAGNDFIVVGPAYSALIGRAPELARRLCPRRTSVGADGLIMLSNSDGLFMHYCNSDGSTAAFCGNGARCMVLYCAMKNIAAGRVEFRTLSGHHTGEVLERGVRVSMAPARLERKLSLEVSGRTYEVHLIRAGVPHVVVILGNADMVDVESVGSMIRSHAAFGDEGANVDFVTRGEGGGFAIRTYERGVEGETLACGSGCVAAAHVLRLECVAGDSVTLRVKSGDLLTVEQPREEGGDAFLTGPAVMVFEGHLELGV